MFSTYGEPTDVFLRFPEERSLQKLSIEKRNFILNHQFAFVTFKDFKDADRVVNEFPYLKLNNKKYNEEIFCLNQQIIETNLIEEK